MLLQILLERLRQGHNTMKYPAKPVTTLPPGFTGRPELSAGRCAGCKQPCVAACPTRAIRISTDGEPSLDTGRCLFCRKCEKVCPHSVVKFTADHRLAATRQEDLVVRPGSGRPAVYHPLARREFHHSFALRVVSAGGCGACEADTNVLTTLAWDISRFGIKYVASPRHADGVLVTGPVTPHMLGALRDTFAAVPEPKVVIALGTCAISGGLFAPDAVRERQPASADAAEEGDSGVSPHLPADLFIPGCPPHPFTILDALLRFIGVIEDGK